MDGLVYAANICLIILCFVLVMIIREERSMLPVNNTKDVTLMFFIVTSIVLVSGRIVGAW